MPEATTTTAAPALIDPNGRTWNPSTTRDRNGKALYAIEGHNPGTCARMALSTRFELEAIFGSEMKPAGGEQA